MTRRSSRLASTARGMSRGLTCSLSICGDHEVIGTGETQVLGPEEPHGWEASELRRADGVVLLMWCGDAHGRPRVVLDPVTGALSEEYGHLNPAPA
jgi:hypothetical protein